MALVLLFYLKVTFSCEVNMNSFGGFKKIVLFSLFFMGSAQGYAQSAIEPDLTDYHVVADGPSKLRIVGSDGKTLKEIPMSDIKPEHTPESKNVDSKSSNHQANTSPVKYHSISQDNGKIASEHIAIHHDKNQTSIAEHIAIHHDNAETYRKKCYQIH